MAAPIHNVFVGSETGLLKGVNPAKTSWNNLNTIKNPNKSNEITCLLWVDKDQSSFYVGSRGQNIANYNVATQILSDTITYDCGPGSLKSIGLVDDLLVTAVDSGLIKVWKDETSVCEMNCGQNLHCMTVGNSLIGTGGKETDLKLWDINKPDTPVFQAKNVKNDWLNLRVPVWVTAIDFLPNNNIVTTTGHHQVRVYDPNIQRRPVLDMTFDEYPITAMSLFTDNQIVVGNTQGNMALLDIRKGKLIHKFKGFAGSIRSIQCHHSQPIVASCGLDRFFRLHDINTKQLLHKMYLKSRLNCLLMSKKKAILRDAENEDSGTELDAEIANEDEDEGGYSDDADDVWDNMKVVKTRTVKRKADSVEHDEIKHKKLSRKKTRTNSKKSKTK